MDTLNNLDIIIHFEHFLGFVVREFPVPDDDTETARGKKVTMCRAYTINDPRQTHRVGGASPKTSFQLQTAGKTSVNIRKLPHLFLAIAPARAKKCANIFRNLLLDISSKSILTT